ncbi:MAG: tyrosine-type recombinase/integrase [Actinomycetota bacterium]|nr:tyrosine-type recombinase/integrase [Actinomycetota bacterium]
MAKRKRGRKVVKLNHWVTRFWLPVVRSQLKESTFESYRHNMQNHVLPRLGDVPLGEITPRMLTDMYVELLERGRLNGDRRGLNPKTVRYIHTIAHKAFADAIDDGLLKSNPADRAKAPKPARSSNRELRFWEAHQLARFLRHVRGAPLEPLWHLAAFTGMRRGELCGLRWGDIDFEHKRLSIRRSIVLVRYRIVETTPKTHQARVIDLDAATTTVLQAHRAEGERRARSQGQVLLATDRVFRREGDEVLHPHAVSVQFQAALRQAGLPRIRLHDLRHTHATLAIQAGVSPKVISERLGHHTPEFTMHQYAHVLPGMQAEAAERIADLVAGADND